MITVTWTISHFQSDLGVGLQVWQFVNGGGDGGFSCLVKDYKSIVAKQLGIGSISLALNNQIYDYLKDNDLYIRPAHQKQTIEPKPTNTHTFTVTRYKGIGENPIVVLIDHPTQQGTIVNTLEELRKILAQHDECIYFVADKDDNRLHGLNNWHDECDNYAVVDRIEAYLDAKNESELNSLENS